MSKITSLKVRTGPNETQEFNPNTVWYIYVGYGDSENGIRISVTNGVLQIATTGGSVLLVEPRVSNVIHVHPLNSVEAIV